MRRWLSHADPLDGLTVSEIRVSGLRHVPPESVERHLVTRVGQPFRRADRAGGSAPAR